MKKVLFLLAVFCTAIASAQKFTIVKTTQPFYDIIEWKGMGALLLSKDPSGNSNQIYLTLVGEQDKSIWEQRFAPQKLPYYYISSENARYVYFLRNLNPESGKIYFDQLNSAGNVKNTSVTLTSVIKTLGYDAFELELKNVIVTDKALVHHFRHFDKKEKVYTEIATFITHHNMLVYAVELGKIKEEEIKAGRSNHFQYVGFSGDEICFADYSSGSKSGKGWNAVIFNSKGQEQRRVFLKNKASNHTVFSTTGFGTNGAYYLGTEKDQQNGLLSFHNGKFYFTTLNTADGKQVLELHQLDGDDWKKINNYTISSSAPKKGLTIGIYPLNEALTYKLSGDNENQTLALFLDGSTPIVNNFTESVIYNPSRSIISDKKEFFAVTLPSGNLFFDKSQLKTATDMEFEFIKK
ncbi:hypothetical protein G5B10_10555 [Fluviicola sp. SGL-29]|nr:hypothetical protein [Fluviicola sp. SGL-29]